MGSWNGTRNKVLFGAEVNEGVATQTTRQKLTNFNHAASSHHLLLPSTFTPCPGVLCVKLLLNESPLIHFLRRPHVELLPRSNKTKHVLLLLQWPQRELLQPRKPSRDQTLPILRTEFVKMSKNNRNMPIAQICNCWLKESKPR